MMERASYLVLDTNVWVYTTRLLSTGLGAAALYSLHQSGRRLALPEVIEGEVRKHTVIRGTEAVQTINDGYRLIEQLLGVRDDFRVPSKADFSMRVDSRLQELEELIKRVPFTLRQAKAALERVMEETPPNSYKNQQFKDSAIWEAILDLAKEGDVDFVTEDKAFFRDRSNPHKGLAENLVRDCELVPGNIRVFFELSSYLQFVRQELPSLNYDEIATIIHEAIWEKISTKAIDKGFILGELESYKIYAFLTEKIGSVAIEFELVYLTQGVKIPESLEIVEAVEVVRGDCTYLQKERQVLDVQYNRIHLEDRLGEMIPAYGEVFLRANTAFIGRRMISYTFRERLDE